MFCLNETKFVWFKQNIFGPNFRDILYTEKTVSLIYGQWKNFFELKKVFLIQKFFLWSKEIDLFVLKTFFLKRQIFLHFKEIFSLTVYQRNVSLIQRNYFPGVL